MMNNVATLTREKGPVVGEITLNGSKSISNRVLIIQALCKESFQIHNLSTSDDTVTLQNLLQSEANELDAHHAGTTFRFLTSYLAIGNRNVILTGSERMKERPIGPLVTALQQLGANIKYVEKDGYPPLNIAPAEAFASEIDLAANISSQYISSLLLVAPNLPKGLTINLIGDIVSRPYLEMTLSIMQYFGVEHEWNGQQIKVAPQAYQAKDFTVEADWSAASYYYIIAGIADEAEIKLNGLGSNSLQGDSEIVKIAESFGMSSSFDGQQLTITKSKGSVASPFFEYDFVKVPDIAQSIAALCAGMGTSGLFSGLQTLRIKETDRIAALQTELAKVNVFLSKLPEKFSKKSGVEYYMLEGQIDTEFIPVFDTYKDHRMAMALAPLGMIFPIQINEPMVVTKSYPKFYEDLQQLGFKVEFS